MTYPYHIPTDRLEEMLLSIEPHTKRLPPGWLAFARLVESEVVKHYQANPPQPQLPALPAPLDIIWPELHSHALGCGVEDRGITDRYQAAEYGWQDGFDKAVDCLPPVYDADQMREYAGAAVEAALANCPKPQLPPMDAELRFILGRPNFTCGGIAEVLRRLGQTIPNKAEEEQAAVIYFMLELYLVLGKDWMDACERTLRSAPAAPKELT